MVPAAKVFIWWQLVQTCSKRMQSHLNHISHFWTSVLPERKTYPGGKKNTSIFVFVFQAMKSFYVARGFRQTALVNACCFCLSVCKFYRFHCICPNTLPYSASLRPFSDTGQPTKWRAPATTTNPKCQVQLPSRRCWYRDVAFTTFSSVWVEDCCTCWLNKLRHVQSPPEDRLG